MAEDVSKIIVLGAVSATFNGVELGHTTPNTKVTWKTTFHEAKTGKYGDAPTNIFRGGSRVEVDMELMQTDIAGILASPTGSPYPQMTLVSGSGLTKMTFGQVAGLQNTKSILTLTSFIAANTPAFDLTLSQATPIGMPELIYTSEKVQIWKVKFVACIDEGKAAGAYLGGFGNNAATADLVLPVVSAVVPAAAATSVAIGTSIVWTLSKVLNGNTVTKNSVKLFNAAPAGAATEIVCNAPVLVNNGASTTITLQPTANLTVANTYLAILTSEIQDQVGNTLATYDTKFST